MKEKNLYSLYLNTKEREKAIPGDIIVNYNSELKIISPENFVLGLSGEPVAVVYCPAGLPPDKIPRAISLVNMSTKNPKKGTRLDRPTRDNIMYWGKRDSKVLPELTKLAQLTDDYKLNKKAAFFGYLSSTGISPFYKNEIGERMGRLRDKSNGLYVSEVCSGIKELNELGESLLPSPISAPKGYFYPASATSDMDGKKNTWMITEELRKEKKINSLNEINFEGLGEEEDYYCAFSCCSLFSPDGTSPGDWYLPSIGEIGILLTFIGEVNKTLEKLEVQERAVKLCIEDMSYAEDFPHPVKEDGEELDNRYYYNYYRYGSRLWSSTSSVDGYCWIGNTYDSDITTWRRNHVYGDFRVRASLMF